MAFSTKVKTATGAASVAAPLSAVDGSKTATTAAARPSTTDAAYELQQDAGWTETPGYIKTLAPFVDTFNWILSPVMLSLPVFCTWGFVVRSVGAGLGWWSPGSLGWILKIVHRPPTPPTDDRPGLPAIHG